MVDSCLTISNDGQAEVVIKRSRFRCLVRRVFTEEQAREVIREERARYWDARHHCSAFILEPDRSIRRSSDDGEPAGTAGMPILQVLEANRLTDVVAVVTRWFGGTLLGAGGLVRAYSQATSEALTSTAMIERRLMGEYLIEVSHLDAGKLEAELRGAGVAILEVTYGKSVELLVGVLGNRVDLVSSLVAELSSGRSAMVSVGQRWVDQP